MVSFSEDSRAEIFHEIQGEVDGSPPGRSPKRTTISFQVSLFMPPTIPNQQQTTTS